jgi:hypothetical protein
MNSGNEPPAGYSGRKLAQGLCLTFGAASDTERAAVMPICITIAAGMKTLTANDSRTPAIIDLFEQIIESNGEGIEVPLRLLLKLAALRQ